MFNVSSMFTDPLIYRLASFTNVRCPTRTRNNVDTFPLRRVYRIFNRFKRAMNRVKGLERRRKFMFLKDPGNPISGSLNERKVKIVGPLTIFFYFFLIWV